MLLLMLAAIMILEIPPIITATPTKVPIAHNELYGHLDSISTAISKLAKPSSKNHPHPFTGRT
jgi:hypothetical protein